MPVIFFRNIEVCLLKKLLLPIILELYFFEYLALKFRRKLSGKYFWHCNKNDFMNNLKYINKN